MPENPYDKARPPSQKVSPFFAAVRARGLMNAMLDAPAMEYERLHPGRRAHWEYWPPSGDLTFVQAREGEGYTLVDYKDLIDPDGEITESQKTEGRVRVGDLVLMEADEEFVNFRQMEDAKLAFEDYKLPETTYRQYVEGLSVKLPGGQVIHSKAVGEGARMTTEELTGVTLPTGDESEG